MRMFAGMIMAVALMGVGFWARGYCGGPMTIPSVIAMPPVTIAQSQLDPPNDFGAMVKEQARRVH